MRKTSFVVSLSKIAVVCFAVSGVAIAGCGKQADSAGSAGNTNGAKSQPLPSNVPPEVAKSVKASQDMGNAMQQRASANGAAMAAVKLH